MYNVLPCEGKVLRSNNENYLKRLDGESNLYYLNNEDITSPTTININEDYINSTQNICEQLEELLSSESSLPNFVDKRKEVVETLSEWRFAIIKCENGEMKDLLKEMILDKVNIILSGIRSWSDVDLSQLNSDAVCSYSSPISQYFHLYLDIQWLCLSIKNLCTNDNNSDKIAETIEQLVKDMVKLCYRQFIKINTNDLIKSSPFICQCNKQFWLFLQISTEERFTSRTKFWEIFNEVVDKEQEIFSLWLMVNIAGLHYYSTNGLYMSESSYRIIDNQTLLDRLFQRITKDNESDTHLLTCLQISENLFSKVWLDKLKMICYKTIWEYFYKNLNKSLINVPKSAKDILDLRDRYCTGISHKRDSLHIFLYLLTNHLKVNPLQWKQIQARFYTRFVPDRMKEFDDRTVFTILFIYIVFTDMNFDELMDKILVLLTSLTNNRQNTEYIWNFYIALILLHAQKGNDITKPTNKLMELVTAAANDRTKFDLIKLFAADIELIFRTCGNRKLGQTALLQNWLKPYLQSCRNDDLQIVINMLSDLLKSHHTTTTEDIPSESVLPLFTDDIITHVLPALQKVASTSSQVAPPAKIGGIAATIAKQSPAHLASIVTFFTSDAVCQSAPLSLQFLRELLKGYPERVILTSEQQKQLVQAWTRCLLSSSSTNQEITTTTTIIKLDLLKPLYELHPLTPNDLKFPLAWLMTALRALAGHGEGKSGQQTARTRLLFQQCFGGIEVVARIHIQARDTSHTVLYHVLAHLGLLVFHCAELLHSRVANCPLTRVLNVSMLSSDVCTAGATKASCGGGGGLQFDGGRVKIVRRVWHLYFEGMYKLYAPQESFILRMLRDMVVRYVVHCADADSPIVQSICKTQYTIFILEMLNVGCLLRSANSSTELKRCSLLIIKHSALLAQSKLEAVQLLQMIAAVATFGVLEVVMYTEPLKALALTIFQCYAASAHTALAIGDVIRQVTTKHLAFSTRFYFGMMTEVVPIIPAVVRGVLPDILGKIVEVEEKREVVWDDNLRNGYRDIEMGLKKIGK